MPRRETEKITRHHVHLFEGDWERLQRIFGSTIGVAKAIRTIIREVCDKVERKAEQKTLEVESDQ